jgi:uncharacterized metal-binding protein
VTNDEKMLRKAKDNLERIRREYSSDKLKHLESAAMAMVEVYEKKVQEGRKAIGATE